LEELTKKISKELGTGFLSDSEDDIDDDDEDDAEFRAQLMEEFKRMKSTESSVPKQKMKQIYLKMMKTGPTLMKDKTVADQFLSQLSAEELSKLMEILQMEPEDVIKFFNQDPEVIEAIKTAPGFDTKDKGLWGKLMDDDLEDEELDLEEFKKKKEKASEAVKGAIKTFEENMVYYSQNPQELLTLTAKLSPQDESLFLEILFYEYTPAKMQEKLGIKKPKSEAKQEECDHDLVASIFKEVFSHFKVYKKNPQKFNALTDRLNSVEKIAFESLVKAFWDTTPEKLKL
jgi:hypothetical protein